jgi:hypothetical protein
MQAKMMLKKINRKPFSEYRDPHLQYICTVESTINTHEGLTVGIEEGLRNLEPLMAVLVVETVGELVGHMRHRADSLLRVGYIVHLE